MFCKYLVRMRSKYPSHIVKQTFCTNTSSFRTINTNRPWLMNQKNILRCSYSTDHSKSYSESFSKNSNQQASIKHGAKNCRPMPGDRDTDLTVHLRTHVDSTMSYAYGRSIRELQYISFTSLIEKKVHETPDEWAVSIHDQGVNKTYRQLNDDINRLATGMALKFGLRRGDAIGLYAYNCYESLLVYYASNKLGLVLNPFNPSYKSHELNYVLQKSDIKCLFMPGPNSSQISLNDHWAQFCNPQLAELVSSGNQLTKLENVVILDGDVPKLAHNDQSMLVKNLQLSSWNDIIAQEPTPQVLEMMESVSADDLYCIYYTSGTTGVPKGASVTQFNAINCISLTGPKIFTQRPGDLEPIKPILCCPLPLFHAYAGIAGALLPFVNAGGPIIFTGAKYNIRAVVNTIKEYKCNVMYVTPTILIDLLTFIESHNITGLSLRTIIVGGAKIIPETVIKSKRLISELEDFRILYGSSENGVIATVQSCIERKETQLETVGTPLDLTEVRIVDPNTNVIKPLGESGEIQTRGFNTMAGYLGDPERTLDVITESGWYKTGDLGIMDTQGSVQIVGRIKELIIKGGENIYPAEVEAVFHQHPDIEDAQVFGVPDPRFGEEVAIWIKLKMNSRQKQQENEKQLKDDIMTFCKAKLTYFKLPKYVIFVEEFPTTAVKKIKKFEMRAKTIEMLKLKE